MKITRVVTELKVNDDHVTYKLNGVKIYLMTNGQSIGGVDTTEKNRGYGFSFILGDLLSAIATNKPGVIIDLNDPDVIFFLKRTKCIP